MLLKFPLGCPAFVVKVPSNAPYAEDGYNHNLHFPRWRFIVATAFHTGCFSAWYREAFYSSLTCAPLALPWFCSKVLRVEDPMGICSGVGLWHRPLRLPHAVSTDSRSQPVWCPCGSPHLLSVRFHVLQCICWLLPAARLRNAASRKLPFQLLRRHLCSSLLPAL